MKSSEKAGKVTCACWNSHYGIEWKRNGRVLLLLTVLMVITLVVPYSTTIARQAMPAFLPFISQSAGSPPMSGMLAVPMLLMAFIAVYPIHLLHQSINHRNVKQLKKVIYANRLAPAILLSSCLGGVIVAAYPVGYTTVPSKFEWIVTVLLEHSFGATLVLVGSALYQFFLTFIWWHLPDTSKASRYIKAGFCVAYVLLFLICSKTILDSLFEELGPEPFNIEMLKSTKYELPVLYSVSYIISAVGEWAVCILSALNYLCLYGDLQRISFRAVIRHKSCYKDIVEPLQPRINTFMTLKTIT